MQPPVAHFWNSIRPLWFRCQAPVPYNFSFPWWLEMYVVDHVIIEVKSSFADFARRAASAHLSCTWHWLYIIIGFVWHVISRDVRRTVPDVGRSSESVMKRSADAVWCNCFRIQSWADNSSSKSPSRFWQKSRCPVCVLLSLKESHRWLLVVHRAKRAKELHLWMLTKLRNFANSKIGKLFSQYGMRKNLSYESTVCQTRVVKNNVARDVTWQVPWILTRQHSVPHQLAKSYGF
jgi:hypothetical protein